MKSQIVAKIRRLGFLFIVKVIIHLALLLSKKIIQSGTEKLYE